MAICSGTVYISVVQKKNGKFCSGVWELSVGDNIVQKLKLIGDVDSAVMYTSKKLAMDVSHKANEYFMANNMYAFKRRGANEKR